MKIILLDFNSLYVVFKFLSVGIFLLWQVVYAIMHRQEVFQPFRNHPRFNELLENIFTVCPHILLLDNLIIIYVLGIAWKN